MHVTWIVECSTKPSDCEVEVTVEHSCNTQHSVNTLAHNSALLLPFSNTIAMGDTLKRT